MDSVTACIICNWADNVSWLFFGFGALGAAAAAAEAGGLFRGRSHPHDPYDDRYPPSEYQPYARDSTDDTGDTTPRPPPRRAPRLTNFDNWLRELTEEIMGKDKTSSGGWEQGFGANKAPPFPLPEEGEKATEGG